MKRMMMIILTLVLFSINYQIGNSTLRWYNKAPGTWHETGPDRLYGDKVEKTITSYTSPEGKEYITSYVVECWGNDLYLCFLRQSDQIGIGLYEPPSGNDTLIGSSTGNLLE